MKIIIFLITIVLFSCGKKSSVVTFEATSSDFEKYVNTKSLPVQPNLQEDIAIINNDYPFEIALYEDGRWYYDLPNLDTGFGTWKYNNGKIELHAKRTLFDMYIDLKATSIEANEIVIEFSDRFGPRVLKMEKNK